jgi:predicted nucleotidyltransferase
VIPADIEEWDDILSVVLFGSVARGDSDPLSDKDVFVMCADLSEDREFLKLKEQCRNAFGDANVSAYRLRDVKVMTSAGSLFMWHLKMEGKILLSRDGSFENEIKNLNPYMAYRRDFATYRDMLADTREALRRNGELTAFDLGLLFTLARNTCMLLCMKAGVPKFGRRDVYHMARELSKGLLPISQELYEYLLSWKMWYERAIPRVDTPIGRPCSAIIVDAVQELLDYGADHCL